MRLLSRSHNQEHGGFGVLTYNRYARARGGRVSFVNTLKFSRNGAVDFIVSGNCASQANDLMHWSE